MGKKVFCTLCGSVSMDGSAHRFPQNDAFRKRWISFVQEEIANFIYRPSSRLCSKHFIGTNFYATKKGRRFLDEFAIPTIHVPKSDVNSQKRSTESPKNKNAFSSSHFLELRTKLVKGNPELKSIESGNINEARSFESVFLESIKTEFSPSDKVDEEKSSNNVPINNSSPLVLNVANSSLLLIVNQNGQKLTLQNRMRPILPKDKIEKSADTEENPNTLENNPRPVNQNSESLNFIFSQNNVNVENNAVNPVETIHLSDLTGEESSYSTESETETKTWNFKSQELNSLNGNMIHSDHMYANLNIKNFETCSNSEDEIDDIPEKNDAAKRLPATCFCGSLHDSPENIVKQKIGSSSEERKSHFSMKEFRRRHRQPRFFGDFIEDHLECPVRRKAYWEMTHQLIARQQSKIKTYAQRARRAETKANRLKNIIKKLF